ncbi:hypothetical protein [Paracoccus mutanolyticus]|uniref:hypothetical protein n=1 Tax=Paracoccus mutanolyticus TaxID=1499308 RepID=UPI00167BE4A0|nr:hypothetical protein [Paracoccus mutanolyticus]
MLAAKKPLANQKRRLGPDDLGEAFRPDGNERHDELHRDQKRQRGCPLRKRDGFLQENRPLMPALSFLRRIDAYADKLRFDRPQWPLMLALVVRCIARCCPVRTYSLARVLP